MLSQLSSKPSRSWCSSGCSYTSRIPEISPELSPIARPFVYLRSGRAFISQNFRVVDALLLEQLWCNHAVHAYACACVRYARAYSAFFKLRKFRTVVIKLKKRFSSFDMTPPAKWFLDREDNSVFVCTSTTSIPDGTSRVDRQGFVRDIKTGFAKGKSVLKVIVRPYTHQCLPMYTLSAL